MYIGFVPLYSGGILINSERIIKAVLITGGSRGIGRELVRLFSNNGYSVAFTYRSSHNEAESLAIETGALAIKADSGQESEVNAAIKATIDAFGRIDCLINNAAISSFSLFTDISNESWRRMIDTNLSSAFTLSREAAKVMVSQKSGKIVNVGSVWGRMGASCEVHYSASKAGLRGLTQALAKELGPSGITVNCVEPGVIDTDMNSMLDEAAMKELADATPLCRIGKAEEVAAVIGFLASEEASFITGACIPVDGGFPV
jgi:3-oxoacyl-[acyl-carrier protein] reductase